MWPFKPRTESTVAAEVVATTIPSQNPLKVGTWVKTSGGSIGILTANISNTLVEVTYTKADGTNVMMLDETDKAVPFKEQVLLSQVQRALISDIPISRYGNVSHLRTLGYGDK